MSTGVGQELAGTYGTLVIRADGTFTYELNNLDPDTNLLGDGMKGEDRFTYTYSLNGVVSSASVSFVVSGLDEPGQIITTAAAPIKYAGDVLIGALQRIESSAYVALLLDGDYGLPVNFTNDGVIASSGSYVTGLDYADRDVWYGSITNNGLIEVVATRVAVGAQNSGPSPFVNNGIIRVAATYAGNPSSGVPGGGAMGITTYSHLETIINNGTLEVIAPGKAFGIESRGVAAHIENSGYLYVSGGYGADDLYIVGIKCGQSDDNLIVNSGTIHVVSTTAGVKTYGIILFPDSSNAYQYGTVLNSGTIVATTAIQAVEGYATGIHVVNSGWIEGGLWFDKNLNMVTNVAGATWIGELKFGLDQDVVVNAGKIVGNVLLGEGDDVFDGRGGRIVGTIEGGAGRDLILGGNFSDQINAGDGNDRVQGGGGADTLSGGNGSDVFVYTALSDSISSNRDTIVGFQTGVDKIDLSRLVPTSISFSQSGGFTILSASVAGGVISIAIEGAASALDVVTNTPPHAQNGTSEADSLFASSENANLFGDSGNDLLHGGAGNDILNGGEGSDTLYGWGGDDTYIIDNDADRVIELEGGGVDEVRAYASYTLQAFTENLTLLGAGSLSGLGNERANVITGNSGSNSLSGDDGNDTLIGGGGADTLNGGIGDDVFVYTDWTDSTQSQMDYIIYFDRGSDKIDISQLNPMSLSFTPFVNYWTGLNYTTVSILTAAGTSVIQVDGLIDHSDFIMALQPTSGSQSSDQLAGTSANDWLEGRDGNDRISGLAGSDTLNGGSGNDRLFGGDGHDVLTGGDGSDGFFFNSALNEQTNFDRISDFSAEDTFYLDTSVFSALMPGSLGVAFKVGTVASTPDEHIIYDHYSGQIYYDADGSGSGAAVRFAVIEKGTALTATNFVAYDLATYEVKSAASYTLVEGERNLLLIGESAVNGSGNTLDNRLTGNEASNQLVGLAGMDIIAGMGGDDIIDGGAGADQMSGGRGNDTFVVDQAGDVVTEIADEGIDLVRSSVSFTLAANVENLTLAGVGGIAGTGNALDNIIRGTDAANSLYGLDGADRLYGNGGDDTIEGGAGDDYLFGNLGNDTLNGGAGYDRMYGGVGDDTYIVNDADDYAYELAGEGNDRVVASVDHQLRSDVEDLTLTGTAAIGEGNASANVIVGTDLANKLYGYDGNDVLVGNGGDDYLLGGAGNDQLTGGSGYDRNYGGTGDDTYIVTDLTDYAYENAGEGYDTVIASLNHQLRANIEQLVLATGTADLRGFGTDIDNSLVGNSGDNLLYGRGGSDTIVGNAGNDILYGDDGNDTLNGGTGQDRFYGGTGADIFAFDDGDFAGMSSGTADRIHDFSQLEGDLISLADVDANVSLASDQAFTFVGTAAFSGVAGELRYQQIVGSTYVQGDINGDGVADFWIRVEGLHSLSLSDFIF